ncbi:hypothetical protein Fcan01_17870 [Folsomia candida]|uniref:Uncharacterized protein n=1 Tax=Folsomia candida TaxID=158441 RepID=A0A226DSF3_FOLCA|nr:hypothetical protein Fcan01_17870 [Folsomia candida]
MDQSNSTHAIVHFPSDDTVEIVPTSWLNYQATHCQFPPTGEKGVKKIKKRSGAPLNHWAVYEAAVLKYFGKVLRGNSSGETSKGDNWQQVKNYERNFGSTVTPNEHGRRLNNILNLLNTRGNDLPEIEDLLFSFPEQFFPLRTLATQDSLNNVFLGCGGDNLEECLELMARYLCSDELLSRPSYQGRIFMFMYVRNLNRDNCVFQKVYQLKLVPFTRKSIDEAFPKILKRAADRYMKKMKAAPSFTPSQPENTTVGQ